jgi:phosphoglycerate dehydrogenase-like enzyme
MRAAILMKIVIHPPVDDARFVAIREAAGDVRVVNARDEAVALAEMDDADAFLGKITPRLLSASRKLRWVQSFTASLEHYVFPDLVKHPCTLTNMRGLFSDVIADHVFGFILCFARNLHLYLRRQLEGRWAPVGGEGDRPSFASGLGPGLVTGFDRAHVHLSDCTLGVVGMGGIGAEVARRGLAFGMRVLGVDPARRDPPVGVEALWPVARLDELLGQSDFVVICAPQTPETAGLFHRGRIQQMKRSAILINVGRGAIVPLADLVAALGAREIAGAALDVFEIEPLPPDHPLWKRENVILTPHVAAASVRIAERHQATLLDNVRRFARGEELRNVVDKEKWF